MLKEMEEKYQQKFEELKKVRVYQEQLEKELIYMEGQLSILRQVKVEPTEESKTELIEQ